MLTTFLFVDSDYRTTEGIMSLSPALQNILLFTFATLIVAPLTLSSLSHTGLNFLDWTVLTAGILGTGFIIVEGVVSYAHSR